MDGVWKVRFRLKRTIPRTLLSQRSCAAGLGRGGFLRYEEGGLLCERVRPGTAAFQPEVLVVSFELDGALLLFGPQFQVQA